MFAVEFETQVKNGTIQIPKVYQTNLPVQVKVIILAEKPKRVGKKKKKDIIASLLDSPLSIPDFKPLTREEIYAERIR